jgi:hypothetical protein
MLATLSVPAEARRRVRIPFLGGHSSSEKIILVADLKDRAELRREDGNYIDLGYLFSRNGDKWIGHIGSSTQYVNLTESKLKQIIKLGGLDALPPVPARPTSMEIADLILYLFWGLIAAFVLAAIAGKFLAGNRKSEDDEIMEHAMGLPSSRLQQSYAPAPASTVQPGFDGRPLQTTFGKR